MLVIFTSHEHVNERIAIDARSVFKVEYGHEDEEGVDTTDIFFRTCEGTIENHFVSHSFDEVVGALNKALEVS